MVQRQSKCCKVLIRAKRMKRPYGCAHVVQMMEAVGINEKYRVESEKERAAALRLSTISLGSYLECLYALCPVKPFSQYPACDSHLVVLKQPNWYTSVLDNALISDWSILTKENTQVNPESFLREMAPKKKNSQQAFASKYSFSQTDASPSFPLSPALRRAG